VTTGVTAPQGFRAAGLAAGLKASGAADVAVVVNDGPLQSAAGVFTSNRFQAAPVLWSQQVVAGGEVRVVVLNSGGANACTGPVGFQDTHATAEHTAGLLGCGAGEVAVCSTGLIGERLAMHRLIPGVTKALGELSPEGGPAAATAIMTTDTVPKEASLRTSSRNGELYGRSGSTKPPQSEEPSTGVFTVGGMAKGAGMLAPGLATMLVVLTTDAVADAATLDVVLRGAVRTTFDRVDSDGCMSTNDTVLLLASGASGAEPPREVLESAVHQVCADLALQLVRDAEGASKDIVIEVVGAVTEDEAVDAARAVARSNLFKCAVHGEDPNWGRVLSAVGTTAATFEPDQVAVTINGVKVCVGGAPGEDRSLVDLSGREVGVVVDLAAGAQSATLWTNDLTAAYVHENSAYST
jgi:glutamate N-acetyltransferase / amino-acid N-acetyltransferase